MSFHTCQRLMVNPMKTYPHSFTSVLVKFSRVRGGSSGSIPDLYFDWANDEVKRNSVENSLFYNLFRRNI